MSIIQNYYSLNQYLRETCGRKVYKLALTASTTCPNRDGTLGTGGCTFCSAGGSGDFAETDIDRAKTRVRNKTHDDAYIAYYQSYTGTYGDLDALFTIYTKAISRPDILILSIATRPDCLGPEVLERLEQLNRIKPVWVELGLQTSNEKTAEQVHRGYRNEIYETAVRNLNALGIKVVTHVILGLPGETFEDMKNTVEYACQCGTWGLKLQLLHVLKGTELAEEYEEGKFHALTQEEYLDILCRLLPIIPEDVVIHRLTGDGPKNQLIAPLWSANKRMVLNTMNRTFQERHIIQGGNRNGTDEIQTHHE